MRDGEIIARAERSIGIRPLGARGRDLLFDGQRFVLRGVSAAEVSNVELTAWHDAGVALVMQQIDESVLAAASRVGVLIVAELAAAEVSRLPRLARFPAVGMAVLPGGTTVGPARRRRQPAARRTLWPR